ncbi:MAG: non-canonical purine NTP pyrophosphatase [Candidatus Methanomethylicaceae archaeon]
MDDILFITTNEHKLQEANRILSPFGVKLNMSGYRKVEIQSRSLVKIARYAAQMASKRLLSLVLVEDLGLFFL